MSGDFAIMVILFLSRKIPMAFSALIAMVLLIITGCIDANSALATFGSTTVITMASMYIVAAGLARTQMINKMSNALLESHQRFLYKSTDDLCDSHHDTGPVRT